MGPGAMEKECLQLLAELELVSLESSPGRRRRLYRQVIQRLEVDFETRQHGKRRRHFPVAWSLSLLTSKPLSILESACSSRSQRLNSVSTQEALGEAGVDCLNAAFAP